MAASNDGPTKGTPNEAVQQHQSAEMPAQPDGDVMDVDPDKALEAQQIKEDLDQLHELYIKVWPRSFPK